MPADIDMTEAVEYYPKLKEALGRSPNTMNCSGAELGGARRRRLAAISDRPISR